MAHIQKLPANVVNKIAAGEVIERPASVVKELLENALDAGATRIDLSLQEGGLALIRVADNGAGIDRAELGLAVASHATSKLRDADDLFRVRTLGFRGEALASIAAVSHLRLRSRTPEADSGGELEALGGEPGPIIPCGCPVGTSVEVRNLFYNTPARRKYLRTTATELGHASEAFVRVALAHPQVHFTLQHQDRVLYDLPPVASWRERIALFFGDELSESLLWVEGRDAESRVSGYVAHPGQSRANNRMQYLFLNGRYIRDRSLQHALSEAYRGLLLAGRYPVAFLRLEMPPATVDVNVHPTKLEVRFQDGGRIYSQVLGTLRSRFLSTDLTAKVQPPAGGQGEPGESAADPREMARHREEFRAWARGESPPPAASRGDSPADVRTAFPAAFRPLPEFRPFEPLPTPSLRPHPAPPTAPRPPHGEVAATSGTAPPSGRRPAGLQLHNRYLVTESDQGMVVIDQHALHERILYEQLRQRVLAGKVETQRLLVPEPVSLTASEAAAVLNAQETLKQLGIEVQPFGGGTVLISAYPAMLAHMSPCELLRHVVDLLLASGTPPERRDLLDEFLHMISCKAAIKAGDRLAPEEIQALLEQRDLYPDAHHCPHGRPTALLFTREELDRRFKRI